MRLIASTRTLEIPSDVSIEVKARKVRVKGPRGTAPGSYGGGKAASGAGRSGSGGGGGGPIAAAARSNRETSARCFALSQRFSLLP